MSAELRITDTNSANDTRGRAFGLEGNDFVFVVIGFVVALALCLGLTVFLHARLPLAIVVALPALLLPAVWVLVFRNNKPAGYADDWMDEHVSGRGWAFQPDAQPTPLPYEKGRT